MHSTPTTAPRRGRNAANARAELDDIVTTRCQEHEIIDNALRSYLNVTTNYKCTAPPTRACARAQC